MGITLTNIRTNETVTIDRPAQLAAFVNSSDLNINGERQDHGWRLAPAVILQIEAIKLDTQLVQEISRNKGVMVADLRTHDFLSYIVEQQSAAKAMQENAELNNRTYKDAYDEAIRRGREAMMASMEPASAPAPVAQPAPVEVAKPTSIPVVDESVETQVEVKKTPKPTKK